MFRPTHLLALLAFAFPLSAQDVSRPPETVGSIDFFGLRRISESDVRAVLQLKDGDPFPRDRSLGAEVRRIPGVAQSSVTPVTVDGSGKLRIFIGVREEGSARSQWREKPAGDVRLTDELKQLYDEFIAALGPAVRRGGAHENYDHGHALSKDAELRKPQDAAVEALKTQAPQVRDVMLNSDSAEHRCAAAWLLGYAPDKKAIVADLLVGARDPDSNVRNNATRALGVLASFAEKNPDLKISIPYDLYIDMLNSVVWTDLNKASFVLFGLTEKRDPALLDALRERALPVLIDMARWKSGGHAHSAIRILGRIAGWSEEAAARAIVDGKIEELVAAASAAR